MANRKGKTLRANPPARKNVSQAYNDFTIVLEDVYSKIDAVGELVDVLKEKTDNSFSGLEEKNEQLDRRLIQLEIKIGGTKDAMTFIKKEISNIGKELKHYPS